MVTFQLTAELKNYIRHLMTLTTNADTAYRIAKEEMSMTRAEVRQAWRETARSEAYATLLKTWGKERVPPKSWGVVADFRMRDNYIYLFDVRIYNGIEKTTERRTVSYYSPELKSFDAVWSTVKEYVTDYADDLEGMVEEWYPAGLWKRE